MKHFTDGASTVESVKDFSVNTDGTRKDGSKSISVSYTYEYDQIETKAELDEKFSVSDLIKLANARLKGSANTSARQKALAPYQAPADNPEVVFDEMLKGFLKMGVSEDIAKALVAEARAKTGK